MLLLWTSSAASQVQGDRAALQLVAATFKENYSSLKTWQGEVEFSDPSSPNGTVTNIGFACDLAKKKYMFLAMQRPRRQDSKQGRLNWGGLRTPDGYYHVPEWNPDDKSQMPTLLLRPHEEERRGDFSPDFDPFLYFQLQKMDTNARLAFFINNADKLVRHPVHVSRERNLVTLLLGNPKANYNRYIFDLDQGGNPIEVNGVDPRVTDIRVRSFEKVSGVWVPKAAYAKNVNAATKLKFERKLTWMKNIVNEPIPEETFTPDKIGVLQGSSVHDSRTDTSYSYDTATSLEGTNAARLRRWTLFILVSLLAITVVVLLVGWRIRCRKAKDSTQ